MLLCHPREENIPHASGKKVATGDVSRSIAAEDHGHADGTLEFVAHRRFKNRRFLPVGGQSEFPVLHCEAIGSLKFGKLTLATNWQEPSVLEPAVRDEFQC